MAGVEKTVFISYRRSLASYIARAVFQDLSEHDYDVFMDVESIDSGTFDTIILSQIAARAHFVVILTPGTLDRCVETGDWLRREIERAIELKRNIVPLLSNDFSYKDARKFLTGGLEPLSRYNGITLYHEYFEAGMEHLRERFLKIPVEVEITPASQKEAEAAQQIIATAAQAPLPSGQQRQAEEHFSLGYRKYGEGDFPAALQELDQALELNPGHAFAYTIRGVVKTLLEKPEEAVSDFDQALRLDPGDSRAYGNRGNAYFGREDYQRAIADYDQALRLDPQYDRAYYNRGLAYQRLGIRSKSAADFRKLLSFSKDDSLCQAARERLGELGEAVQLPQTEFAPDERVFAYWKEDKYWYPAVVRDVEGQRVYVRFDNGNKHWNKHAEVVRMDLEVGEDVQSYYKDRGYFDAHVLQINGESVQVEYVSESKSPEDPPLQAQEWTTLSMIRAWR